MGLMSLFLRKTDAAAPNGAVPSDIDSVAQARVRARRRLIGAVVLVAAGVVGFPLLFETQPRPIPIDIPIDIPRKEGAPALNLPQAPAAVVRDAAAARPAAAARDSAEPAAAVITESPEDAGREVPPPSRKIAAADADGALAGAEKTAEKTAAKAPSAPVSPAKPAASKPVPAKVEPKPAAKPPAEPEAKPKAAVAQSDAARAKALLEGKSAPKDGAKDVAKEAVPDSGRYVIQVGAFADNVAAHTVRLKVERLGMKTYTQVAQTPGGPRIRVRVGPFATRAEAEKAQARAKAAGLPAAMLAL